MTTSLSNLVLVFPSLYSISLRHFSPLLAALLLFGSDVQSLLCRRTVSQRILAEPLAQSWHSSSFFYQKYHFSAVTSYVQNDRLGPPVLFFILIQLYIFGFIVNILVKVKSVVIFFAWISRIQLISTCFQWEISPNKYHFFTITSWVHNDRLVPPVNMHIFNFF